MAQAVPSWVSALLREGSVLVSRKVKLGTAAWAANQLCTGAAACAPAQDDPGFLLHSTCSSASGFCVQFCALQLTKHLTILSVFREGSTRWSGTEYFLRGQAEGTGIIQRTEDLGRILQGPSWGDGARRSLWYTAEEQEKMVRLTWGRFWLEINNQTELQKRPWEVAGSLSLGVFKVQPDKALNNTVWNQFAPA